MSDRSATTRMILFTDLQHICCGDLEWLSPDGRPLPLLVPPEPQVAVQATTGLLPHGVRLVAQPARKLDPLPAGTRIGRVVYDDGVYRTWHLDAQCATGKGAFSTGQPDAVAICAGESADAFAWKETARCQIDIPGQTCFDGFTVFLDPKAPPAERYKAVYSASPPKQAYAWLWEKLQKIHPRHKDSRLTENEMHCIYGVISPDGIRWTPLAEPLLIHKSDTDTSVYYDSWLERYVMYTRLYWQDRRWIGRAEAEDFRRWGPVEPLVWPRLDGSMSDDIYTNGRTEHPGVAGSHLMFPMVYHRYDQTSEVRLYSSADGVCWNEVPGGPVLTHGTPGNWDSEFICAGKDLVPFGTDRVAIPCAGTCYPHKYPRWKAVLEAMRVTWAWWPRGRLCAVAAEQEGEFCTRPLAPAGRQLRLNVRTHRAGEVRVGLLGIPGRGAADCAPICGDSLAQPVHWRGETDLRASEGQPLRLQFKLRAAEVFALEWVETGGTPALL
ncbi:MAG: hypothetical protein HY360_07045 [Verrucomicrobia bacterium]|nr:hypothetical protein [Verrucomicrobiota bacterium]